MSNNDRFPTTATTLVEALMRGSAEDASLAVNLLAQAYWKPIYKYVRLRWRKTPEHAEDLTQGFFAEIIGDGKLTGFTPERARLRTFIRRCLDNYVVDQARRQTALKRGGGLKAVVFDHEAAERELSLASDTGDDPEELFHREWLRRVVELAREELSAELTKKGKTEHLRVFEAIHDREPPPTHEMLAASMNLTKVDVNNRLNYARRAFRRIVVTLVSRLAANDEERSLELAGLSRFQAAPNA